MASAMTAHFQIKRKDGVPMPVANGVAQGDDPLGNIARELAISAGDAVSQPLPGPAPYASPDYRQLLDRAPCGVCQIEESGGFLYANRALAAILGYPAVEDLLTLDAKTQLFRDPQAGESFFGRTSANRAEIEAEWKKSDGTLIRVRLTSYCIPSGRTGPMIHEIHVENLDRGRFRDTQARQAETMQALGRLASKVAHDFNNVLGVVMGYTQLLHERLEPHDILHNSLEQIVNTVDQAASLTRQLLGFSRKLALEPRIFGLDAQLHEIEHHLEELLGPGIELVVRRGPNPGRICADPAAIDQVILNLAVHAREAMPHGGRLTIEIASASFTAPQDLLPPGAYVRLAVTDTGPSIGPQELTHIFEPFFSSPSRSNLNGLGLATVYEIVRQSGGYIWVRSQPGEGASFVIHFPRAQRETERGSASAARAGSPHRRKTVFAGKK
jgi:two-component system, cell cycle sensor histidine kinase and response regulator CckA